jgi:hypothetical protein
LQNRQPYGNRPRPRRGDASQRNLLIAVGIFVLAVIFVGAVILTGRDGNDDDKAGLTTAVATQGAATTTPSQTTQGVVSPTTESTSTTAPTETATDIAPTATEEATEPVPTATTEESTEPTATTEPQEEAPTATTEPIIGEFGQLPPAQIVSGGPGRPLTLTYDLDRGSVSAPETADVYQLIWPEWTSDEVATIAGNLGIDGTVDSLGGGNFQVMGSSASLHVSADVVQYTNSGKPVAGTLGDDDTLVANAQNWLADNGLVPGNVGSGSVIGRDEGSNVAVVFIKPANPSPLLAAYPSASVTLGPQGNVREANIQWPVDYAASTYGMKSLDEVWNRVLAGQGAVEADLSEVSGSGAVSAAFSVTDVGIAYSLASGGSGDYLVPLMVFSGSATSDDGTSFPVSIYISAVQGESSAAG